MNVRFDPLMEQMLPGLVLGIVAATGVQQRTMDSVLATMLDETAEQLRQRYAGKAAAERPEIAATRRAYRALGDDPTRYRPANEALLRRVLNNRALPQINLIVDINTLVSLESGFALGCYDLARLAGPIVVRRGAAGETYAPIGKPAVDAMNRLVIADDHGIFGSPTADSQRTMVTGATRDTLFVIFAFESPPAAVEQAVARAAKLLTDLGGATIREQRIVTREA